MTTTRRGFLTTTAMMSAAAALAHANRSALATMARPHMHAPRTGPLSILILGGTGFLGPATIDAAKARGHHVTIFNRGRREKFVGARDGVEKLTVGYTGLVRLKMLPGMNVRLKRILRVF